MLLVIDAAEAALSARGRRLVVLDDGDVTDDLVRHGGGVDLVCALLYGRRSARNRTMKVLGCAQRDVGPAAFVGAGGQDVVHG
jgi:putative resolvase